MKTRRNRRGFTMAEMLIVVAIIAALAGVSVVAVQRYQRSMAQLEYDAIAKEIFVAAQNHLTVAEGQDFLNLPNTAFGTAESSEEDTKKGVYYFVSNKGSGFKENLSLLDLMLPFGSIDETVRTGGNFIVRYQLKPATVLDVFYSESTDGRFEHTFSEGEYTNLLGVRDSETDNKKSTRQNYGGAVLGWYGGAAAQDMGSTIVELKPPTIEVENDEQLRVIVTDTNLQGSDAGYIKRSLKLIIEGRSSGAKAAISLDNTGSKRLISREDGVYTLVLDDVTDVSDVTDDYEPNWHFYHLDDDAYFDKENSENHFIPGEDITLSAVTCGTDALTNIAYSNAITTNSLFAGVEDVTPASPEDTEGTEGTEGTNSAVRTAQIANFRHLENLSNAISMLKTSEHKDVGITAAVQLEDLDWPAFDEEMGGSVSVFDSDDNRTSAGCYMPINPNYALAYDGQGHWIKGVRVQSNGDDGAGLFGSTTEKSSISNLVLTNFSISAANGSAGALAGTLKNTTVENVVAYYMDVSAEEGAEGTPTPPTTEGGPTSPTTEGGITSTSGNAGGLVGSMTDGRLSHCAAALYVSGKDAAGGLVGVSNDAALTACYSGGHTKDGKYEGVVGNEPNYAANVLATGSAGSAGGLIGSASGGTVTGCYSTSSVSGYTAGGLAGVGGATFASCYATGRVTGTKAGAFAGTMPGSANDCQYIEIINEEIDETTGMASYLPAVSGGTEEVSGITAADADAAAYSEFMGVPSADWVEAAPYDSMLVTYYNKEKDSGEGIQPMYPLKSLARLNGAAQEDDETESAGLSDFYVNIHYGDWPAPELFVEN